MDLYAEDTCLIALSSIHGYVGNQQAAMTVVYYQHVLPIPLRVFCARPIAAGVQLQPYLPNVVSPIYR